VKPGQETPAPILEKAVAVFEPQVPHCQAPAREMPAWRNRTIG
jgi:hypothetical protein